MHFVFAAAGLLAFLRRMHIVSYLIFIDGSAKAAVLGFFVQVTSTTSTSPLETLFSHLDSIQFPGTTTQVPEIDFSEFEALANNMEN